MPRSRGHEDAEVVADVALRVTRQEHAAEEAVVEAHEVLDPDALDHVRICSSVCRFVGRLWLSRARLASELVSTGSHRMTSQPTVPHAAHSREMLMSWQASMGFAVTTAVRDMT